MRSPALLAAAALLLSGCAASPAAPPATGIQVVASTNVYADIAREVGGNDVTVTAIIDSPSKDPHDYEASSHDLLAVSRADLIVQNGAGYDSFMGRLLHQANHVPVLTAVDLVRHQGDNEHVWYDLATARAIASAIADDLVALDPAHANGYRTRADQFDRRLDALNARVRAIRESARGRTVLATEPVPLYLLFSLGLRDRTPPELSAAVEEGGEIAPGLLLDTISLLSRGGVDLLAYNSQAESGQTRRLRDAAATGRVPVVAFSETLPARTGYLDWMAANVDHVASALSLRDGSS
jgi:zinc/manganese transport system substrate-binding protein